MVSKQALRNQSIFLIEPKKEIEAVLFDMDGVLADTIPLHMDAWDLIFKKNNLPALDRKTYLYGLGRTNLQMLTMFLDLHKLSLPLSSRKTIIETKEAYFRELVKEQIFPTPGVIDWLNFFKKKKIRCSLASSGEMANITLVLESLHISDYFASIISGAHLPASKPDPTIFTLAAASLGIVPDKCFVIEDAVTGIQAVKSAKMICCAIATTLPIEQLQNADIRLGNLSQVDPESLFSY